MAVRRMLRTTRATAVLTLVLSTLACGDSGKDVGPDLAKLCDDPDGPYMAYQAKISMCTPGVAGAQRRAWGRTPTRAETVAACRASLEPYLKDGVIAPPDATRLAACTAWLQATACNLFDSSENNPCRTMLQGTVGGGSYCERDEECMGDSYCDGGHDQSCGICKPRATDGSGCSRDAQCVSGYCGGTICAVPGADMAACTSSLGCAGQLVCVAAACAKPPVWAVGTACTPGDAYQCVSSNGLLECGADGKCAAASAGTPGAAEEGAACTTSAECGPLLLCYEARCRYVAYSGHCPAY